MSNYDALQEAKPSRRVSAGFKPVKAAGGRVAHRDSLTDAPSFIWARKEAGEDKLSASGFARMAPADAALAQLKDHAALYGVSSFEAAGARVVGVSQERQGLKVVKVAQEASGIEVFRQSLNLLLDRNNELVAISGTLSKHVSSTALMERVRYQLTAAQAISAAYQDLTGSALDSSLLKRTAGKQDTGRYSHFELVSYARPMAEGLIVPARAKQVLYSLPNALVPAYYVEINTGRADSNESDYYSYVISAADGSLLMRNNLTAHADYSYRVFADTTPPYQPWEGPSGNVVTPHPTGNPDGFRPPYRAPELVTLQAAPFSQSSTDAWLPDGATVTTGNNVDAYADLVAPDNYNDGDLRPTVTAPGVFDRTMLFDIQPNANAEQIAAATTSLFFLNNWLHDWFYDAGFDEAWGNAQADNYGRGGLGGDAIRAQAQDYTGINNANMQTPSDGASPRMQMYVFSGPRNSRLTVNTPAALAGDYQAGVAAGFGPQAFDVTGDVVAALDEANTSGTTTTDACTALTNAADVAGKIAMVDRGTCAFTIKMQNAQAAGAIGVIINDNAPGFVTDIGGAASDITIPSLRLTQANGNLLRGALGQGVNVRMFRGPTLNVDGTVDNQIVAHEWGHYISNRLVGDANGLINNQGRAMGEGWGDFTALLMTARAEDINVPSNANWNGVYAMAEYATRGISVDAAFFGIRRGAYSVDSTKNALRFRHIMDGVPLPTNTPFVPGGVNSQVHNSGEIWASMLWECYVSLLRAHPFQEAQDRMKFYLVGGYKMTPVAPTYTEARDAILSIALANDPADFQRLWMAFARRGMGVGAVAPDRYSTNHAGVVESYQTGVDVELVAAYYADSIQTPGDADNILDNGENGYIVVQVQNKGSDPAQATSATVVSTTPGVTVGNRGSVNFPSIAPGAVGRAEIPVTLSGAGVAQRLDFVVSIRDDGQVLPGDKTGELAFKANYDEVRNATATETVEASNANLPWAVDADETLVIDSFGVVYFEDLNRAFYGPNLGGPGDIRLYTPPLNVSATQPLVLNFRHAYDLEADASDSYDGAVIELSDDGGQTWADIGAPVYNSTLVQYAGNLNPLQGRRAISGTSAGFPAFIPATLNLGTAYAGRTVRIRFRIGSDNAVAYTGWLLDDLSFSGITHTPFTKLCADNGVCGNTAPVVNAGPDLAVDERTAVTVSGASAYDMDGQALTYAWTRVSGPAVTLTGANTLTPSFTAPEVTANGTLVLRLTVSDGTVTANDTVSITIRQVNRPPTVNAGLDGIVDERSPATLSGSASDADNNPLTYLWTQVSGTPVALRDYNSATALFLAPEVRVAETLSFRLTVSDGQSSVSDTVDVVVNNVNRAPVVTASSVSVDERSTATLAASATDADDDALTYAWTQLSGAPVVLSGDNTASATFATGEVAEDAVLSFRVSVSDGIVISSQDVVVNVRNVNRAPTANAGLDGTANERTPATLTGSASDVDGDSVTYLWTQVSGTPVALRDSSSATASFLAPEVRAAETLSFRLTVSDGQSSVSDTVDVVVNNVNRAPVVTASSVSVDERSTATLTASAIDADEDSLTYAWTQLSGAPVVLSGDNTASATFATGEVAEDAVLTFRVTVSDGTATSTQDVVVNVRHVNRAPTVNAGLDGAVNERNSGTLSATATDLDGDELTYTWVQTAGTPVALANASAAQTTFTAPETVSGETLTFVVTVSDGKSSVSDTVDVSVNAVNRAPLVAASSVTVDERSTASLVATGSDPDSDSLTYSWIQVNGTEVALTGANTASASFATGEVAADSTLTFRVSVSDGTLTASQDVVVTVRHVNRAPTVNAGLDGAVNERGNGTLSATATDLDGDELTYTWVQTAGTPVGLSNASAASATFTAPETVSGETLTFVVTVSDGKSSVSDTVDVSVNAVNRAPSVAASAVTVDERSTASLVAIGSDPDSDSLTYSWIQVNGTEVALTGANTASASFATGEVTSDSELTFQVTVSDGTLTSSQNVVVTVRHVNRSPVANAGAAAQVAARATATLDGRGSSDPENTQVTYQWTQVGGPAVTLNNPTSAQPTFTAPDVKVNTELRFQLTVSDGALSSNATVVITVTASNRAPVAVGSILLNGSQTSMTLDGSGSTDADGDTLTYKWEQTGGPAVQLGNPNRAVLSVDVPEIKGKSATFSFKLTVTDALGGTHEATVEATATPDDGGGCSSTGGGAPAGLLGLALLALVNRRRLN